MGIVSFLLGNKNLVIGAILLALIAGTVIYIKILKSELSTANAQKAALTVELQVSQASVKTLQQSITDQNAAIDKMKSDADARTASHQAEIKKAKTTSDNYKKQAEDLMKLRSPQNIPKCDAANDIINREIQNAK